MSFNESLFELGVATAKDRQGDAHAWWFSRAMPPRGDCLVLVVTSASCNKRPTAKTTNANNYYFARW